MILITGATGHIGNVLARALIARGEKVRALILPGEDCRSIQGLEIETISGDITQPGSLEKAMLGVGKVFHLAGIISILPGKNKLLRLVNVQGTLNVLQACWKSGIERLVYTSSIHALARVPNGRTIDESIPFDPANPYGEYDRSKAEASLAVLQAARQGLNAVIACPTGVIGPYDYRRSEMGQLILDCVEEKPQLYVNGAYDFVDVRDVAEGLLLADEKGRSGETYILSGEQISVEGLIGVVQKAIGRRLFKLRIPMSLAHFISHLAPTYYRLSHTRPRFTSYSLEVLESNSIISHSKAQSELGYAPRSLYVTLSDTVHWFKENRHLL
ncbi:MAG: SDR family oxidoreductase [Anaerolineales bacterium]|jgi:dihydroflavonol-4-reductase|nr:SDR family oxidoreductase [Anaerolineales bacterium]